MSAPILINRQMLSPSPPSWYGPSGLWDKSLQIQSYVTSFEGSLGRKTATNCTDIWAIKTKEAFPPLTGRKKYTFTMFAAWKLQIFVISLNSSSQAHFTKENLFFILYFHTNSTVRCVYAARSAVGAVRLEFNVQNARPSAHSCDGTRWAAAPLNRAVVNVLQLRSHKEGRNNGK